MNFIKLRYNAGNDQAEQSVRYGNVDAQLCMGCLYANGYEINQNIDKAIYWYQKASKIEKQAEIQLELLCQLRI